MVISVLSKHLPSAVQYIGSPCGDSVLESLYLVEAARHHSFNLNKLVMGQGKVPDDFESGVDFKGEELDNVWRFMASVFEFEAFLTNSKRFLDKSWRCLQNIFIEDGIHLQEGFEKLKEIDTIGAAVACNELKIVEMLNQLNDFSILKEAREDWGKEVRWLRNYIEHYSPLGGRTPGYFYQNENEKISTFLIPDEIKDLKGKDKREFKYENKRLAHEFSNSTVVKIDLTFSKFITEGRLLSAYR